MDASTFLLQGAALGLAAAFSPGAFQTYLITQTLAGGWRRGAAVSLAPLLSDPIIILIVLLLLNQLPSGFLNWIGLAGGLFAFYLAGGLWREWRRGPMLVTGAVQSPKSTLFKGALINLFSPGPYTFWALVCGPILLSALRQSLASGIAFLGGFYFLFIGAMLGLVAVFHQARRLGPRLVHSLTLASIVILVLFGMLLIWRAFVNLT